jgi:hypothetical protein
LTRFKHRESLLTGIGVVAAPWRRPVFDDRLSPLVRDPVPTIDRELTAHPADYRNSICAK